MLHFVFGVVGFLDDFIDEELVDGGRLAGEHGGEIDGVFVAL